MRNALRCLVVLRISIFFFVISRISGSAWGGKPSFEYEFHCLRAAIEDLIRTFGDKYPGGACYLARLEELRRQWGRPGALRAFKALKREALLANPLLRFEKLLLVKRRIGKGNLPSKLGFPHNHLCNSALRRTGWDNEIAVLSPPRPEGSLSTLYRPADGGYVGQIDLHWEGHKLLFTKADRVNWKIWEISVEGSGLRQVSRMPDDVDCFDPCYLPDEGIVFGCTANFQSVPCWHGLKRVSNLYRMNPDGSGVRRLCFDQDHDFHPVVLPDGRILFHRWDYTGINHIYHRQLMVMNPDGTGQRAVYGSNSWFPNALYFPQPLPGAPGKILCILSGYHGVPRMGQLVVVDINRGWHEAEGLCTRISGKGDPIRPVVKDRLVDEDLPKFLTPFPLSDKYFLVSCQREPGGPWGIYLADVFDNLLLIKEVPGFSLFEPVPVKRRPRPHVIPDTVDLKRRGGVVYLHDVYAGGGLAGVPRGTIKKLRILSYHFGYLDLAGPDKVGYGGPWEVMRIEGTVEVEPDGSALFEVPDRTPLAVQALDAEGKAVQLMRSWFTVMPGEHISCVGCHERVKEVPATRVSIASQGKVQAIKPWYGPPRGFDFEREVQPVLDHYCVKCHNGSGAQPDLRPLRCFPDYRGRRLSDLAVKRLHPKLLKATGGWFKYTPAYEALLGYIRRVSIEDDVSMLLPGEYHADTSELIQMLKKGHGGVELDPESWDRICTWIDLNAPCWGTWHEVARFPTNSHKRRIELERRFGGRPEDPECIPVLPPVKLPPVKPRPIPPAEVVRIKGRRFWSGKLKQRKIDLGEGKSLLLVRIPPGRFVMGDPRGYPDERPLSVVTIKRAFWLSAYEITNEIFALFDPSFDCGYYSKLKLPPGDGKGLWLNRPKQPVVRVCWNQAMAFCKWLSRRTGLKFSLPTEAQWEYACRAGSSKPLFFEDTGDDFSLWANLGDRSYAELKVVSGGIEHLDPQGRSLCEKRFNDGFPVTAPVGSFRPNPWGLYDMHGNAAEWTRSLYRPYPYRGDDGRNDTRAEGRRVARGGSFFDRPKRARSAVRFDYQPWHRVFNVGFRVVCEDIAWGQ